MAMLGAFYSGGKNDPKLQAEAWYLILGKYDYRVAEQAVLHFAENDTRDYATFPTVGKIVEQINKELETINRPISEIIKAISYGKWYDDLTARAKELISEDVYHEWLNMDAEEFANKSHILRDILKGNQQRLLTYGKDQYG